MEPDEPKTEVFDAPPTGEWADPKPRYFGVTPHGLAAVLAAFAFGAGVVLLVAGYVLVGVLLLVAAALLALIWAEQARRSRATAFDRVTAAAVDHTRALAGFTGSSVRAWTTAGREIARLRLEANRLAKQRSQLQYALGGASYAGDDAEVARLRDELARSTSGRRMRRARERGGRGDAADDRTRAARGGPDGGANARRAQMTIARLPARGAYAGPKEEVDGRKVSRGRSSGRSARRACCAGGDHRHGSAYHRDAASVPAQYHTGQEITFESPSVCTVGCQMIWTLFKSGGRISASGWCRT